MIAGAGSDLGADLSRSLASLGARVVAMDRDECAILQIAGAAPGQIETLQIDELRTDHCALLRRIWSEEPVALLIQLQILRHPSRPAQALRSVVLLTRALRPALEAGNGQVVYIFAHEGADAMSRSIGAANRALAPALHRDMRKFHVGVNGVMLPEGGLEAVETDALARSFALLSRPGVARFGGAILSLMPRSD